MGVVEVPGCPEGSLAAANYVLDKKPDSAKFLVPDRDCVAVLRYILPLLGYRTSVKEEGGRWLVEAVKSD